MHTVAGANVSFFSNENLSSFSLVTFFQCFLIFNYVLTTNFCVWVWHCMLLEARGQCRSHPVFPPSMLVWEIKLRNLGLVALVSHLTCLPNVLKCQLMHAKYVSTNCPRCERAVPCYRKLVCPWKVLRSSKEAVWLWWNIMERRKSHLCFEMGPEICWNLVLGPYLSYVSISRHVV